MDFGTLSAANVLNFTKVVAQITDQNLELVTPVHVYFVMENTMFEHTYTFVPDYDDLLTTLFMQLNVDAAAALEFKLHMDDTLLTSRNTLDLLHEIVQSAITTPSVILMVTQHIDIGHRTAMDRPPSQPQKGPCRRFYVHAAYLLVLFLIYQPLTLVIESNEDTIEHDIVTIARLANNLSAIREQQDRQDETLSAVGHRCSVLAAAKASSLTTALAATRREQAAAASGLDAKISRLEEMVETNDIRIRNLSAIKRLQEGMIVENMATIGELAGSLTSARRQHDQEIVACAAKIRSLSENVSAGLSAAHPSEQLLHKCASEVAGETVWRCSASCTCIHV